MRTEGFSRRGRGPFSLASLQTVSLVALAAGLGAKAAQAETTVSTAVTTPVQTATANSGAPDNVVVSSTGSITINSGTALTLNSSNTIVNSGDLISLDDSNVVGITIDGSGNYSGTLTNNDLISLTETYAATDTDSDGNLDGAWSNLTNKTGILLTTGSFDGDIIQGTAAQIIVHGANSQGVRLDGTLNGDLNSLGGVTVRGDNSIAFDLNGPINGDVTISGTINGVGLNSEAVDLSGDVSGFIKFGGAISAYGFFSNTHPTTAQAALLDPDDLRNGGSAIAIHSNVGHGVEITGIGVEDDLDDDGDGINEDTDTDDDATGTVQVYGSSPAVLIQPTSGAIVIGPSATWGYGFVNRGTIGANGVYDGFSATGVMVGGGSSSVTLTNGLLNDGRIASVAYEADATGLRIGANANVPAILSRNAITAQTISDGLFNAYAVHIDPTATVNSFTNNKTIVGQLNGEVGNAYGIFDESGSITSLTNTGSIVAQIFYTDSDLTDNVVPTVTGHAIALDFSANTTGVTINQVPEDATSDLAFTDQDTVDNDVDSRPAIQIVGEVRLGSGDDHFNVHTGSVTGDISFGDGADALVIDGGSTVDGTITKGGGSLTLSLTNGSLNIHSSDLNIGAMTIGDGTGTLDSVLRLNVSDVAANSSLLNVGAVTFNSDAHIIPLLPDGLPADNSLVFLDATAMTGANYVTGPITGVGVPYVYNVNIVYTPGPETLSVDYALKTPTELGLNRNGAAAFDAVIAALRTDPNAAEGFSQLETATAFNQGYNDLLPNFAATSTEITTTTIERAQSASTNRLATARLRGIEDSTVWLQEVGFSIDRDSDSFGEDFRGHGFGVSGGIDAPLNNGAIFGLSVAVVASETDATDRTDSVTSLTLGQANAYLGTSVGPLDLDMLVGVGVGRITSSREVAFGAFKAKAEGDAWTYEGHASLRASAPIPVASWLVLRPYAEATYVGMEEQGYTESGGGTAVDLTLDDVFSQRLWAEGGVMIQTPMHMFGTTLVPQLTVGYRTNALDDEFERTAQFTSPGSTPFTLVDDSLGDGGAILGLGVQGGDQGTQVSLTYEGEFSDVIERHSLLATIRFRF